MTLAPSEGLNIHYQDTGDGPPLVVLAGFTCSGQLWPTSWVAPLEARHRVLRVDNRGTGRSELATSAFTITDMALDAFAVLDHAGTERASVLGWSMGGIVAQEMAVLDPGRVEKVVLANTWPPGGTIHPEAIQLGSGTVWTSLSGASGLAADELRDLDAAFAADPPNLEAIMFQAQALQGWTIAEREMVIAQPTLVLHGVDDPLVPVENGRQLAKLIPHAQHVELEGVGHMFAWEEPARTAALINAFLAE